MTDSRNPFDELPQDMVGAILEQCDSDLTKSRFALACKRFYDIDVANMRMDRSELNEILRRYSLFQPLYHSHIQRKNRYVKQLLQYVANGSKAEAEAMIIKDPSLLKETAIIKDYAGRFIEGTALRIALGAKDVSCGSQCDVVLITPPVDLEQLTTEYIKQQIIHLKDYLRLHRFNDIANAAYIRCGDKLFYMDQVNDECIELQLDQAALVQFDKEIQPQFAPKSLSKEQLNNITSITGHDHDEEMAEMIMRHLRLQDDGEKEIAKQISEQFPEGWEKQEEERIKRDAEALNKVLKALDQAEESHVRNVLYAIGETQDVMEAIGETQDIDILKVLENIDQALALVDPFVRAIMAYRQYLDNENKGRSVIKTGYYFNEQLVYDGFKLYDEKYVRNGGRWDSPKNLLFWRILIGGAERNATGCFAQALCQNPYYIVERSEKLRRSLDSRFGGGRYFPQDGDSSFILGRDYACYPFGARRLVGAGFGEDCRDLAILQTMSSKKTASAAKICAAAKQLLRESLCPDVAFFSNPEAITAGESSQHESTKSSNNSW